MKKKTVTVRELQHQLGKLGAGLKPGDSLLVTRHGKPFGVFTKAAKPRKAPDFLANLEKLGQSIEAGQKLLNQICELS